MRRLILGISCLALTSASAFAVDGPQAIQASPKSAVGAEAAASGKKPDFNGVWGHGFASRGDKEFYSFNHMPDISMLQPWAQTEFKRRFDAMDNGNQIPNTSMLCLPAGVPSIMMEAHVLQIIQTDTEVIFLAESDHQVRVVRINGTHPVNMKSSWYGDSIGHWEGDTLVMDTVGLNDKTQLDPMGTPHSAALHVSENMRMLANGSIEDITTLDDPLTLTHPWVYSYHYTKGMSEAHTENVEEYACAENNKDGYVPPEH